jgi:aldose 1-epimerase
MAHERDHGTAMTSGGGMDVTAPSGQQWTIEAGEHRAVLVEVGGGLRTYQVAGAEVLAGFAEHEMSPGGAGQILAPWPNRIRDGKFTFGGEPHQLNLTEPPRHNAIHGLVNWVRWAGTYSASPGRSTSAGEQDAPDAVTLTYDLPPQPGYPWPLALRSQFRVGPDGLTATHHVTNLAAAPAPFGFSVHPYFIVPGVAVDDLTLVVPGRSRLLVDGRLLPIGAARVAGTELDYTEGRRIGPTILDTAFGDVIRDDHGGSSVTLTADDGRGVRVWADHTFGWWQVFTSDTLTGDRHRRAVAVEPMTCPPDAFRSGRDLVTLEPGQVWSGTWGVSAFTAG